LVVLQVERNRLRSLSTSSQSMLSSSTNVRGINTEEGAAMLSEDDRERIRRAFHLEKKSIRQIAKEEGCSRDTIRGAISNDPLKPYQLTRKKPAPVFGPYQLRVEALLHQNDRLPRKQRYTAHRLFAVLREAGYR